MQTRVDEQVKTIYPKLHPKAGPLFGLIMLRFSRSNPLNATRAFGVDSLQKEKTVKDLSILSIYSDAGHRQNGCLILQKIREIGRKSGRKCLKLSIAYTFTENRR